MKYLQSVALPVQQCDLATLHRALMPVIHGGHIHHADTGEAVQYWWCEGFQEEDLPITQRRKKTIKTATSPLPGGSL